MDILCAIIQSLQQFSDPSFHPDLINGFLIAVATLVAITLRLSWIFDYGLKSEISVSNIGTPISLVY